MRLSTFIDRLKNISVSGKNVANQVIFMDRQFIEGSITERLSEGSSSDGTEITNEVSTGPRVGAYSKRRYNERKALNLQTNHVDLKETGRLYSKIKYKKIDTGGAVVVEDEVSKVAKLERLFGGPDLLWGISDDTAQFIADRNAQEIADRIAKLFL